MFIYYINCYTQIIKQNKYGKIIIDKYNIINNKYVTLRITYFNYCIIYPLQYLLKKIMFSNITDEYINNIKMNLNKNINSHQKSNIELKTNKDIDEFLDKILIKNKTK